MKEEIKQFLFYILAVAVLIIFSSLYAIGGSGDFWGGQLWIRRWLAPFIVCVYGAIVTRGDWKSYAFYPLICGSLCLPYGADTLLVKIILRGIFGLSVGLAFNLYNFLNDRSAIGIFGVLLAISGSIVLGVFNPMPNAIVEQGFIAILLSATYILSVRKRT